MQVKKMQIWETIVRTTVRLECHKADGKKVTGTGFFYSFESENGRIPGIISNKHVIDNCIKINFYITVSEEYRTGNQAFETIVCTIEEDGVIPHPDKNVDLAFLPTATLLNRFPEDYYTYFQFDKGNLLSPDEMDELDAVENIYLVGYPREIWDNINNLPLVRQGITASSVKELFEGDNLFMIDSACFPGSSGSPVIWYKEATVEDHLKIGIVPKYRYKLVGILFAGPQHTIEGIIGKANIPDEWEEIIKMPIPMNLGYCVNANEINLLEEAALNDARAKEIG